ncbi:hypothetical protein PGRAT_07915 [Paenibacillus graminis]|uniref:PRD domain-containing protein n=1 Tax=Paenibacillus graminis TaxID=189425 RepID=A0A089M7T6_9BACL|nr:hypothetical protein PGRAT_07915 [Paenibacillus graminis]
MFLGLLLERRDPKCAVMRILELAFFIFHRRVIIRKIFNNNAPVDVPPENVSLCHDMIEYAKNKLESGLSEYIYITLTDHMNNVFRLYDEGIPGWKKQKICLLLPMRLRPKSVNR